ncbi:hypothetical protein [Halobellus rarus]|uniref:Uncharacterized protein n=1 Tax=Halobellus rarus TaxID=1126237 RepID=A0ABD6CNG6_9EURY|nr:hypothetical protein [Halobellus rarus]
MSTIDLDSEPEWIEDAWSDKEGDLRLRDALTQKHRGVAFTSLVAFAGAAFGLVVAMETFVAGDLAGTGLVILSTVMMAYVAFAALQQLDCRLREDQECRHCRKETARWEADS